MMMHQPKSSQKTVSTITLILLFLLGFTPIITVAHSTSETKSHFEFQDKKATPAQFAKYNNLVKKYHRLQAKNIQMPQSQINLIIDLYGKMSAEQIKKALPLPSFPIKTLTPIQKVQKLSNSDTLFYIDNEPANKGKVLQVMRSNANAKTKISYAEKGKNKVAVNTQSN